MKAQREYALQDAASWRKLLHTGQSQQQVKAILQAKGFHVPKRLRSTANASGPWFCEGGWNELNGYDYVVECIANGPNGVDLRLGFLLKRRYGRRDADTGEVVTDVQRVDKLVSGHIEVNGECQPSASPTCGLIFEDYKP